MSRYLGVDLGSTTAKAVVVDDAGRIVSSVVTTMGAVSRAGMRQAVEAALWDADLDESDLAGTVSTGYGRKLVPGAGRTFTEITCHARGVAAMLPGVRLVIDVGGQDSKAIAVDAAGLVEDFAMNDRCASGTGRFYEVLARAVDVPLDDLGELALRGSDDLEVSSMCATFAETEIVSMLAEDRAVADIASSVHRAIAARTLALVAQVGRRPPVAFTGGVARNPAAVHFLERALGLSVTVPAYPQITGAYGAALLARDAAEPTADVAGARSSAGRDCGGCDGELSAPVDLGPVIPVGSTP